LRASKGLVLLVHPTCYSSYKLFKELASSGLLSSLRLVSAACPTALLAYSAWSVPWLVVDGKPAAADPLSVREVEAAAAGKSLVLEKDPCEAFVEAVLHSSYASSLVALWGSFRPVVDESLASAAARSPLTGVEPREVLRCVAERSKQLYEESKGLIARTLAYSLARDVLWASGRGVEAKVLREAARPELVGAWLLAKASAGRVGLPASPAPSADVVRLVSRLLESSAEEILERVRREQETVLSDKGFAAACSEAELC